jgi:hypothetical protein
MGSNIRNLIEGFKGYFLAKKLTNSEAAVTWDLYVSENPLPKEVLSSINGDLRDIVVSHLSREERDTIGSLFLETDQKEDDKLDICSELLSNNPIIERYIQIRGHLSEDSQKKVAQKIAENIYQNLDEKSRGLLNVRVLYRYVLNIGFIEIPRYSKKDIVDFMKDYPSIFHSLESVYDSILRRYVYDELGRTPIDRTVLRGNELKKELSSLMENIKNGS